MEETRVNAAGPTPRYYHNTHIVNDKLYLWGGDQPGLPQLHNSPEKLKLSSVVDVIQLPTGEWETVATTGNPPLGIRGYASTVMNQQILFFGGSCNHDDCRHNSLFSLSLVDFKWTKLSPTSMLQGPMLKAYCGMAGLRINGEDYLLVVGGVGPMANNRPYQTEAEYSDKGLQGFVRTNEHHYYKLSTGKWVSPSAISPGQPRYLFTMSSLNDNTVILFGGNTPNGISNTVYVGTCTESSITWQKLVPESIEVPLGHYGHASVLINEEELMIVGGVGTSDCWIFNLYTRWWKQIFLPKTVTGRYDHSLSIWKQGGGKGVSVIVFGGLNKDYLPLSYPEIIELERFSGNHSQVKRVGALSLSEQPLMMIGSEYGQPIPQPYSRSPSHTPYPSPQSSSSSVPQLLHQLEVEKERHRKESSELAEANDQLREELAIISQQKKLLGIKLEHMADENQHNKRELNERDEMISKYQSNEVALNSIIQMHEGRESDLQEQLKEAMQALRGRQSNAKPGSNDAPSISSWLINKSEIEMTSEVLGNGGWGEVRVGVFRGLRVAAKCLHTLIVSDYNIATFSREMEMAALIRHPNIVQFIGATTEENPIILTELMHTSLRKELEASSQMPYPVVLSISLDVACALNYLHLFKPHPILHRDVSSPNVLLQPVGNGWRAKLSDYGSANLQHLIGFTVSPGSPIYSAPEATNPHNHSPAMDVYSFAVLLIEMLTCQLPEPKERQAQLSIAVKDHVPIRQLLVACLNNEYESRPSMSDVIRELKQSITFDFI